MKFTLRDLLWLGVVLAMGFVWFQHSVSQFMEIAMLKQELKDCTEALEKLRRAPAE